MWCLSLSIKLCSLTHESQIPLLLQSNFADILQTARIAFSFVVVVLWICNVYCDAGKPLK